MSSGAFVATLSNRRCRTNTIRVFSWAPYLAATKDVVMERIGGAWDCEASLAGFYKDIDDAIRGLSSTGAVHMFH
jgi:hypothetical protein